MEANLQAGEGLDDRIGAQDGGAVDAASATAARVLMVRDGGFEVIINKGARDGVAKGFRYVVYAKGPEIRDIDTNEFLGTFDDVKGSGLVIHVDEKFSVMRSIEKRRVPRPLTDIEKITSRAVAPGFVLGGSNRGLGATDYVSEDAPFKRSERGDFARRV